MPVGVVEEVVMLSASRLCVIVRIVCLRDLVKIHLCVFCQFFKISKSMFCLPLLSVPFSVAVEYECS